MPSRSSTPALSVIVPTKNRPALLLDAVRSMLAQTLSAAELIVVDQSASDGVRPAIADLIAAQPPASRPALHYVWDPSINGAAAARNAGLEIAQGDLVAFWDDDVLAERDVLARLVAHYQRSPRLSGIAPVITNYAPPSRLGRILHGVFGLGPLRDERQPVYWFWRRFPPGRLVPVRMFTGALMSFRREAVGAVRFDRRYRGASVGEDVDFCWTLGARGARFAIATDARIVHNRAPRPAARPEETLLTCWGFLFEKHAPKTIGNYLAFAWFAAGVMATALYATLRDRTLAPLSSLRAGLVNLATGYARSSFLAPPDHAPAPAPRDPQRAGRFRGVRRESR